MLIFVRARRLRLSIALILGLLIPALSVPAIGQRAPRQNPGAVAGKSPRAKPVATTAQSATNRMAGDSAVAAPALPSFVGSKEPGWLYKGSDITPDPKWSFGTLPNGVRYAVRRNGVPPGQVSVRVRIDAGSLFETDTERGFAHLIEHLSFRGSAYVPDGEAKRVWQRMGTTFGSDTNAQTTPTETVYKLDLPSATESGLDESLKILAGMMEKPNITSVALNAERPVVLAEQREQPGAQVRFGDAVRQAFYAGQPLADRSPIGNIKTLEAATAESVRAFHDRWYRPERAVVILSGDVDPVVMERLIQKNFVGWKGVGAPPAEPDLGAPDPAQPVAHISVEPTIPTIVTFSVLRPWQYRDDTVIFNQKRLVDLVALRVINRRLESRARAGGSYLQANVGLDDVARSANATTVDIIPVGDDWQSALRDVRAVIADASAAAPSQAEIDRELSEFDAAMKNDVDTSAAEAGAKQADDLVQALDIRETVTSAETAYQILQDARSKGMFNPTAMLESTRRVFTGVASRALVNLHAPDTAVEGKLAAALTADVSGLASKRLQQRTVDFSKLPPLGKPGEVASRGVIGGFGTEKIVFNNGVRLLVMPSKSEASRVYVRVRFGGGYGALPANRQALLWTGDLALVASGIGGLGQEDLDALTTGRRIGMDFNASEDAFSFSALTSPADLTDQLYLIAQKLAHPSWDPNPVTRARAVAKAAYAGNSASPGSVLSRELEGLLHSGDPRWKTPTLDQINALSPKAFRAFWQPILAAGPIEVDVFGDTTTDEAIAAVARSLGAIKPRKPGSVTVAPGAFPAHNPTPLVLTHNGPENQAVAVIAWPTGGGVEGTSDSRKLDVLAAIFSDRLFDRLRSEAGASYSPNVDSQWPVGAASGGRLAAIGQVPPDKVDFFFKLSREIAADLVAKPIDADELKRTLIPMQQYILRASTGNTFWLSQLSGASYDERRVAALESLGRDFGTMTPDELQRIAAKYLRAETDWTMAVVPADPNKRTSPAR